MECQITISGYEPFLFMPGMTIEAAIRYKNKYIHGEILKQLMDKFNEVNGLRAPKAGESFLIPIWEEDYRIAKYGEEGDF